MDGIALLTIFILSVFVGFEVVSKVSTVLHTPLMSGANAIHGVVVMGAIIVAGKSEPNSLALWISRGGASGCDQPGWWFRGDRPHAGDVQIQETCRRC